MDSSIFKGNVIVQGITGTHGAFHTEQMLLAGTRIVAGTSPNKAGSKIHNIPVYGSIDEIRKDFEVSISVIFVPAPFAKNAMLEAINNSIKLIVCITEGVPVHDMLAVQDQAKAKGSRIIGPNCPGVLMPGVTKLGIIPSKMGKPGNIGIVSRSGTLTYEVTSSLSEKGIGQKYIIGIGGDRIRGTDFIDCLKLFENDPDVDKIIMIGEIGGQSEQKAAEYISRNINKPVFGYIAGHSAPAGVQLGHAGAILGSDNESATSKTEALERAGVKTAMSIAKLVELI